MSQTAEAATKAQEIIDQLQPPVDDDTGGWAEYTLSDLAETIAEAVVARQRAEVVHPTPEMMRDMQRQHLQVEIARLQGQVQGYLMCAHKDNEWVNILGSTQIQVLDLLRQLTYNH